MSFKAYRVYNFRPDIKTRDLDTLLARKIWSSRISNLNDPFEFAALKMLEDYPEKQVGFVKLELLVFAVLEQIHYYGRIMLQVTMVLQLDLMQRILFLEEIRELCKEFFWMFVMKMSCHLVKELN